MKKYHFIKGAESSVTNGVLIQGCYPLLSLQRNILHAVNVKNEVMFQRESIQKDGSPFAADLRTDFLFRSRNKAEKAGPGSGENYECDAGCWTWDKQPGA